MAAIRLVLIFVTFAAFFLIGAPLQWALARIAPRAIYAMNGLLCRTLLRLAKVRLAVEGAPLCDGPLILAPNHVSWIDILALGGLTPCCFLAKSEIASWPAISAFASAQGTVFVERRRRRTIVRANRQLAERLAKGRPVLLFAEGTTVAGPVPGRFLSSHFAAARDHLAARTACREVAVQPVALSYSSPAAAWIGNEALIPHLWRTLRAPPLRCRIAFGTPIPYRAGSDRKIVARQAREAVVRLLGAPSPVPESCSPQAPAQAGRPAGVEPRRC